MLGSSYTFPVLALESVFLQGALILFRWLWYLETKIWVLGVLTVGGLFEHSELGSVCIHTQEIATFITSEYFLLVFWINFLYVLVFLFYIIKIIFHYYGFFFFNYCEHYTIKIIQKFVMTVYTFKYYLFNYSVIFGHVNCF